MAIDDVLPLKAVRRDADANRLVFVAPGHQRLNFDGFIYIHYTAPAYSARIGAIYLLPLSLIHISEPTRPY